MTDDDFEAWRANKVTESFMRLLRAKAEEAEVMWSRYLRQTSVDAAQILAMKAEIAAKLEFIEDIINLGKEDIEDHERTEGKEAGAAQKRRGS